MSKLNPASRAVRIAHVRMVIERCVVHIDRKLYVLEQIINLSLPVVLGELIPHSYEESLLMCANLHE